MIGKTPANIIAVRPLSGLPWAAEVSSFELRQGTANM